MDNDNFMNIIMAPLLGVNINQTIRTIILVIGVFSFSAPMTWALRKIERGTLILCYDQEVELNRRAADFAYKVFRSIPNC